jgi:allantoinase
VEQVDILIVGGRIAGLFKDYPTPSADGVIEAKGFVVLPGAIDGHTHFIPRDLEADSSDKPDDEGFVHGGRAACAGGVTSIVEMPQAYPSTVDARTFERKRSLSERDAMVDFAMWGGISPATTPEDILGQVRSGAAGFKAYTSNGDPDMPGLSDIQLVDALDLLHSTGLMLGLHTENESLLQAYQTRLRASGRTDPMAHAEGRPAILEIEAVARSLLLAEHSQGRLHVVHVGSPRSAELVRSAKERGVRVTAETCPQYLALNLDDLVRLGPYGKCVPPLRSQEEVEALWGHLADGTIDCITSDHCGYKKSAKEPGRSNIWDAPNGLPGVQTLLPAVITGARQRGFSWEQIARWTATNPARLWRLAPAKGSITPGADADLVLLDPEEEWTVTAEDLLNAQKWSPFEGRRMKGRVRRTILRGETIYDDADARRVLVEPGFGRFLRPNVDAAG